MKKAIYSLITLFSLTFCFGQQTDYKSILKTIQNQNQVDSLQLKNPCFSIQRITKTIGDTNFEKALLDIETDSITIINNVYYKILEKQTKKEFKVKYIWLDANKMSKSEIKKAKKEIFSRYRNGESFGILADELSMDPRKNQGDLGWFPEGRMVPEFEKSILKHKQNEIFEAFQKDKNWHFIILKTHKEKETGEFDYLKISEIKNSVIIDENNKEKFILVTIATAVKNQTELSRIEISQIECVNCEESFLDINLKCKAIQRSFDILKNQAENGDFKEDSVYIKELKLKI